MVCQKQLKGSIATVHNIPAKKRALFIGTKPFTQKLLLQTTLVIIKKQKISEALDLAQYLHIIKMG